jgi:hypothetical protein
MKKHAISSAKSKANTSKVTDLQLTPSEAFYDALVNRRRVMGRITYGTGLDHTMEKYDWNRMALEEAMDLGQYLAAQNRRLDDTIQALLQKIADLESQLATAQGGNSDVKSVAKKDAN